MFENSLKAAIVASSLSFALVACSPGAPEGERDDSSDSVPDSASSGVEEPENGIETAPEEEDADSGPSNTERLAENESSPDDVEEVRATVDAFNESVGEVDLEEIYEGVDTEGEESWEEYKVMVYENARDHIGEVMDHTNYSGDLTDDADAASKEDVDRVLLATSHVSFFQYTFAFFEEDQTSQVVFDNDYIITDGDTAEVFIPPNPEAVEAGLDIDPQPFIDDHIDDQRPMELTKDADGTWIIDADTLAHELPENILETGELP